MLSAEITPSASHFPPSVVKLALPSACWRFGYRPCDKCLDFSLRNVIPLQDKGIFKLLQISWQILSTFTPPVQVVPHVLDGV